MPLVGLLLSGVMNVGDRGGRGWLGGAEGGETAVGLCGTREE